MASYPQFECTLNWMDGFFFWLCSQAWNELVWVYLGELLAHCKVLLPFVSYMIPQAIFCYSVMLLSLFCCALSNCTRKRDGTGSQFIGDGGPAGDANWFRFLPCLWEFMQRTKGMYTPISNRPCRSITLIQLLMILLCVTAESVVVVYQWWSCW